MIKIAVLWSRMTVRLLGIKIDTRDMGNFYKEGPCLLLINHQNLLDIIVALGCFPVRFTFMAKASLFRIPLFGWGMSAADCIPVIRDDRKKARQSLFHAADVIRKKGIPVIIYPEATFGFQDGSLRPFKKGAFILAKKAEVVLQPLTIWGTDNIVPRQPGNWIHRIYAGKVMLVVHKPVMPESFSNYTPAELSDSIRVTIEEPIPQFQKLLPLKYSNGPQKSP